jgi:hypothetical protein
MTKTGHSRFTSWNEPADAHADKRHRKIVQLFDADVVAYFATFRSQFRASPEPVMESKTNAAIGTTIFWRTDLLNPGNLVSREASYTAAMSTGEPLPIVCQDL